MLKLERLLAIIMSMFICNLWLYFSHLDIEYPLYMVLNVISFAVGFYLHDSLAIWKNLIKKKRNILIVVLMAIYEAFVTVGSVGIMYPVDRNLSLGRVIVLCINGLWNLLLIFSITSFFESRKTKTIKDKSRTNKLGKIDYLVLFIVMLCPLIIMLIAFSPGICSYDTNLCLSIYAHDLSNMIDNQPFFYVLFLKMIISIVDSTCLIIIVQILMWCGVWLEAFRFLNTKLHVGFNVILIVAVLLGINSANLFYIVTIWKDIPYTICILFVTVLIAEMIYDCDIDWLFCTKLFFSMIGVFLFRKNGPVTFVFIVISLIVLSIRKRKSINRILCSIGISLLVIWLISGPLYDYVGVKKDEDTKGAMYIGMSQELFAAYKYGEVSDETKDILTVLAHGELEKYAYNPYWANAAYNLDVNPTKFIKCYLESFVHNPRIMIKAILLRQDCMWNIFPGEDSWVNLVNYYGGWDGTVEWKNYYPERNWTRFSSYVAGIARYSGDSPTMNIVVWRSGLHLALLVILMASYFIVFGSQNVWYIIMPLIGQIVSLFLSTGWSDFRYYWSINVVSLFVVVMIMSKVLFERRSISES